MKSRWAVHDQPCSLHSPGRLQLRPSWLSHHLPLYPPWWPKYCFGQPQLQSQSPWQIPDPRNRHLAAKMTAPLHSTQKPSLLCHQPLSLSPGSALEAQPLATVPQTRMARPTAPGCSLAAWASSSTLPPQVHLPLPAQPTSALGSTSPQGNVVSLRTQLPSRQLSSSASTQSGGTCSTQEGPAVCTCALNGPPRQGQDLCWGTHGETAQQRRASPHQRVGGSNKDGGNPWGCPGILRAGPP